MNSNNVSDSLADGQVFESLGKEDQAAVFNDSFLVDSHGLVSDLHRAHKSIRLIGLVGESSIQNDSIYVN